MSVVLVVLTAAAFAMLAPASHATTLDVTCSPSSAVVVGCDQLVPYSETFSPGDLGVYRYVSRSPARNVNRLSVRTAANHTQQSFQLSFWDGTASKASNRLGVCTITNAQPDAWNSCTIANLWVPAGAYRYIGILNPESSFGNGQEIWIRTAGQWGNAPEYEHSNRDLETTPATFTKGNTYTGASPASMFADDVVAPTVTFGDRPADSSTSQSAAWSFSANEPSTFECALDGAAYSGCTSPHAIGSIAVGTHSFHVRATDAAGNVTTVDDDFAVTPAGPTANLWIDLDGGSCTRSGTPALHSDGAACGSLDAAYQAAQTGDLVLIKEGGYGDQQTASDNASLTGEVTIQAAPAETVTFTKLTTRGDWLRLKDVAIATGGQHLRGWYHDGGSRVTLDHVDISGPYANIDVVGGSHNTYTNSEFGTPGNTTPRICGSGDGEPMQLGSSPSFTIENVVFHPFLPDVGNPACGSDQVLHLETIRVNGGMDDLRIVGNVFTDGDGSNTARIFVTKLEPPGSGDNSDNLVIANNYIGQGGGSVSIFLGGNQQCVGYRIAYNFWRQAFIDACAKPNSDSLLFSGNLGTMPSYACPGTQPGHRNLWVWYGAGTCGTDQWLVASDPLLNAYQHGADGYHLTGGGAAIDAGEALADCDDYTGSVDIDGDPRGPTCDAGPDEYTGGG